MHVLTSTSEYTVHHQVSPCTRSLSHHRTWGTSESQVCQSQPISGKEYTNFSMMYSRTGVVNCVFTALLVTYIYNATMYILGACRACLGRAWASCICWSNHCLTWEELKWTKFYLQAEWVHIEDSWSMCDWEKVLLLSCSHTCTTRTSSINGNQWIGRCPSLLSPSSR